jgi:hypothetical protein
LGLHRTYGIPTISKLLVQTKQFSSKQFAGKRYADTEVLIQEFMGNEPDSPRTLDAIARMNYIHNIYQKKGLISNDDLLYTLSLFAIEPERWIRRHEWRPLSDLEICAIGVFWKAQGDAMKIEFKCLQDYQTREGDPRTDGLAFFRALEAWSMAYEERVMVPDINNKTTADETVAILLWDVPKVAHPFGRQAVSALMDNRLRAAMMYEKPAPFIEAAVHAVLALRKYFVRYFLLPRPRFLRVQGIEDEPDRNGRLHLRYFQAEPWYVPDSFKNRYDLKAWFKWFAGNPIPDKQFKPQGYLIPEIGPQSVEGKGLKEQEAGVEILRGMNRGGCPFKI